MLHSHSLSKEALSGDFIFEKSEWRQTMIHEYWEHSICVGRFLSRKSSIGMSPL